MLKRLLLPAVFLGCLLLHAAPALATTVYAQHFPLTGEIRLVNKTATPLPIVFYSIQSDAGALTSSGSVWKSITDNYDAPFGTSPGNGFVDPSFEWMRISATSTQLTEGVFTGPGGTLLPWRPVSLGRIWDPNATAIPDLEFDIRSQTETYDIFETQNVDGDYSENQVVDQFDYEIFWRQFFGSTSVLLADGNLDGVINAADYVVWRKNLGLSLRGAGADSASGAASEMSLGVSAVPEPSGVILGIIALSCLGFGCKRRPR